MLSADYDCIKTIDPMNMEPRDFITEYLKLAGYNPGSRLGNRQICLQCGISGSECTGHPVALLLHNTSLSEFGVKTLSALTSVICRECGEVITDIESKANDFQSLLNLNQSKQTCSCRTEKHYPPTITVLREEKIPETEQDYEWRDGRKRKKKRSRLLLTGSIERAKALVLSDKADIGRRLGINKDYVEGLFYDRIVLLPPCAHPMTFKRGVTTGVEEITGMMKLYKDLFIAVRNKDIILTQTIVRDMMVGQKQGQYSGTQSHLAACDGKNKLFRGPAESKRSLNTGRAVLTPNTYGRTGQIRCPEFLMKNLPNRYIVSSHNKTMLQSEVGRTVTHYVIPMETSAMNGRLSFEKITPETRLKLGDEVLRPLQDGQHAMCHRHPNLHRGSQASYRAFSWKDYCMALYETDVKKKNADFDGDEGNISGGANSASRIELAMIDTAYSLNSGRSGEPMAGIAYNGIVGAYVLSTDDNIDSETYGVLKSVIEGKTHGMQTVKSHINEIVVDETHYFEMADSYRIPRYSGRVLLSMLLPRGLNYSRTKKVSVKMALDSLESTTRALSGRDERPEPTHANLAGIYTPLLAGTNGMVSFDFESQRYQITKGQLGMTETLTVKDVVIKDGFMLRGNLQSIDVSNKLILAIQAMVTDVPGDEWRKPYLFIDRGYAMTSMYIDIIGLTIGVRDYVKIGDDKKEVLPPDFEVKVDEIEQDITILEEMKEFKTPATVKRIEKSIIDIIGRLTMEVHETLSNGPYRNTHNATISFLSGARGTIANIASAVSVVGQIYNNNLRYTSDRSSLYAPPWSNHIRDRSFIDRSYAMGLLPPNVMQVADPARAQALATYLGTPESGKAARETELYQDGVVVSSSLALKDRDGKIIDSLVGYGCNSTRVTSRKTAIGSIETVFDPIAILDEVNSYDEN